MPDEVPYSSCDHCGETIFVGEPIIVYNNGKAHQECWTDVVDVELEPKLIFAGEDE